jgi:hypothetical protein
MDQPYSLLEQFYDPDNYINKICFKFRQLYQEYRTSEHCRASYQITQNVEKNIVSKIKTDISQFQNIPFETLFTHVKHILLTPVKDGGGKLYRGSQGGACGISVLGCYDITMCLVNSIPNSNPPKKVILIKDRTKGPWNYVTKILHLTPEKFTSPWTYPYNNIYFIEKESITEKIKHIDQSLSDKINKMNCDEIETKLCRLWQTRNKNNIYI